MFAASSPGLSRYSDLTCPPPHMAANGLNGRSRPLSAVGCSDRFPHLLRRGGGICLQQFERGCAASLLLHELSQYNSVHRLFPREIRSSEADLPIGVALHGTESHEFPKTLGLTTSKRLRQ